MKKRLLALLLCLSLCLPYMTTAALAGAGTYQLTVTCEGEGSVTGGPTGSNIPKDTDISLTAVPGDNYEFDGWYREVSGTQGKTLPFSSAENLTLSGKIQDFYNFMGTSSEAQSNNTPLHLIAKFVDCRHSAHPIALSPTGYFADENNHWTQACGRCKAALNPVSHVDADSNGICDTCYYSFEGKKILNPGDRFFLDVSVVPDKGGTLGTAVVPVNGYGIGEKTTVSVSPNDGYVFVGWYSCVKDNDTVVPGSCLSTSSSYTCSPAILNTFSETTGTIVSQTPNTPNINYITVYLAAVFETEEEHQANEVVRKIKAIAPVENTEECKERIDAAEDAYNALTVEQKAQISAEVLAILTKAKSDYADFSAVYYSVTFQMNGHGTQITAQTVKEGEKAAKPADPSETCYSFDGWYRMEECTTEFSFDTAITNDTYVYAGWTEAHAFKWQSGNGEYWQKCENCPAETTKKSIPVVSIDASAQVDRGHNYSFSVTPPEGCRISGAAYDTGASQGSITLSEQEGKYSGSLTADKIGSSEKLTLTASAVTADGFTFPVSKTVTVNPADLATLSVEAVEGSRGLGDVIELKLSIRNISDIELRNVAVTLENNAETEDGEESCTVASIPVGKTAELKAYHRISSGDILNGGYVAGFSASALTDKKGTATIAVEEPDCTLTVEMTATPSAAKLRPGDTVDYELSVKNDGNVPLENVHMVCELLGIDATKTLAVGESKPFSAKYTVKDADMLSDTLKALFTAQADAIKDPKSGADRVPSGSKELGLPTNPVFSLTIHYVYENGDEAAKDYNAEVKCGSAYAVDSPEVKGYEPASAKIEGTMPAKDTELSVTYTKRKTPTITAGEGQSVNKGEKKSLTFTSDAAFADFIRAELDGKTLEETLYTKKEGSTVVTLNADYMATLPAGEHTLGIVSENGTATVKFTVREVPVPVNYTLSFEMNGHGTQIEAQTVKEGEKAAKPADPVESGYSFDGWYTDALCTAAFSFDTAITKDTTLYAGWTQVIYSLTAGANSVFVRNSGSSVTISVKRNGDGSSGSDHLTSVQVDGRVLPPETDYVVASNATNITIRYATLQALSVGTHTVTINFDDGRVETQLIVRSSSNVPSTGDEYHLAFWCLMLAASMLVIGGMAVTETKRAIGRRKN